MWTLSGEGGLFYDWLPPLTGDCQCVFQNAGATHESQSNQEHNGDEK
jgi:hypothetical protein